MNRRLPHLALILAVLAVAPGARSEGEDEGGSLREIRVKELIGGLKGAAIPKIWNAAEEIVKIGPTAKRAVRNAMRGASAEGRLAGLKALIDLGSPTLAVDRLLDMAGDEDGKVVHRAAAIELVALTDEEDAEDGLVELLYANEARIRLAAARALWVMDTPRANLAKKELVSILQSADPDLRAMGALALAEIGDSTTPGVKDTLRELMRQPGDRGRLARSLYRNLNLNDAIQRRAARMEATASARMASATWKHLDEVRRILREAYELNRDLPINDLRTRAARGLTLFPNDPHTQFMSPAQYREFLHGNDGVDPSYGGIGAFIDTNVTRHLRILRPIFGGPAWNADIRGGDDIVAVNGESTVGRSTTEIIKQVKGPPGTSVVLSIYRSGWPEPREITVIRAKIVLPTVFSRLLPGKIGYLSIAQFAAETGKEVKQHLKELEAQGIRGLVIDVRNNPGGLLHAVKQSVTPFLRAGSLVAVLKGKVYPTQKHYSFVPDQKHDYPISVLVNGRSASGAELLSGVLQHYSTRSGQGGAQGQVDAVVIGVETFGKGTVQHTIPLRTWPGETFTDEARKNGRIDRRERFTDLNRNKRWDAGEPFEDKARVNREWDDAEPWEDKNGNGKRDASESFTDENGDGVWNPAEKFKDQDGNGEYTYGAALKLTVARYYLPGGKNFTRERVFRDGKYEYKGGVEPDIEIKRERMPVAHLVELRALQEKKVFENYVKKHWKTHKDLFHKLAEFDARETERYPEFDAFYKSLDTRLTRQELRRALRIAIRREVSNVIGKEILGDLSDDNVLRRGVKEILGRLGVDPDTIEEYKVLNGSDKADNAVADKTKK